MITKYLEPWLRKFIVPTSVTKTVELLGDTELAYFRGEIHRDLLGYTYLVYGSWPDNSVYILASGWALSWKQANRDMGSKQYMIMSRYHLSMARPHPYEVPEIDKNFVHKILRSKLVIFILGKELLK